MSLSLWPMLAHGSSSKKTTFQSKNINALGVVSDMLCNTASGPEIPSGCTQWGAHIFVCSLPLGYNRFFYKLAITLHPQTLFSLERYYVAWHLTQCRMSKDFPSLYLFSIAFCQNQPGPLFCTAACQPVTCDPILELVNAGLKLLHLP